MIGHRIRQLARTLAGALLPALLFSACGLDLFSKSERNKAVEERQRYRQPHPECNGLDLGPGEFTAKSFRALIDCFNANDSIPELDALLQEASDEELEPILQLMNEAFLGDPASLAASRNSLLELQKSGELDAVVKDLGGFLSEPARIRAILEFLDPVQASRRMNVEPAELASMEKLVKSLSPVEAQEFLRVVNVLIDAPATAALKSAFEKKPLTDAEIESLSKMASAATRDAPTPYGFLTLADTAMDSRKWKNLKAVLAPEGNTAALLQRSREFDALTQAFSSAEPTAVLPSLRAVQSAFSQPISCYGGGHVIEKPWNDLIDELQVQRKNLPEFLIRFSMLTTLHARQFCQLPPALLDSVPRYLKVYDTDAGQILTDLTRASIEDGSFVTLKEALLANGETMAPLFQVLGHRKATPDLFLALSSLDSKAYAFLNEQWKKRSTEGSLQQYMRWLSRLTPEQWRSHFELWGGFLKGDLEPYRKGLQRVDALFSRSPDHPLFEGLRKVALLSVKGELTVRGLGGLAELKNFDRAVQLMYQMSQDGRAAPILLGLFNILGNKGGAPKKAPAVLADARPARAFGLRHRLSSASEPGIRPRRLALDGLKACLKLDLKASIASQAQLFQECEGKDASLGSWQKTFAELAATKASSGSESLLALIEKEIRFPPASPVEAKELVNSLKLSLQDGTISKNIDAARVALFGTPRIPGAMEGATDILARVKKADPALPADLLALTAQGVESPEFPGVMRWLQPAIDAPPGLPARRVSVSVDLNRLERWVRNKECEMNPSAQARRASEIVQDYADAISGWQSGSVRGRSRQSWTEAELVARVKPLYQRLQNPKLQTAVRNIVSSFTLLPGERKTPTRRWTAAEAVRFFETRSKDAKIVQYLYPGEKQLSVRLMSSLDRLEVVLTAANFTFPYMERFKIHRGENFALKFMGMIGEAWGDSPRELWPVAIQRKYPAPSRPMTQREVYFEIKRFLDKYTGLGTLPKVKRCKQIADPRDPQAVQKAETDEPTPLIRLPGFVVPAEVKANLYNLMRTVSVLEENLPGTGTPTEGGMLFLRDLFYEISQSGGQGNPLELILEAGDLGFLRAISYYFSRIQDPVERAAHVGFVATIGELARDPKSPQLLWTVLSKDPSTTWKWIQSLIRTGMRSPDATLAAVQAGLYAAAESARLRLNSHWLPIAEVFLEKGLPVPQSAFMELPERRWTERARALYADRRESVHSEASKWISLQLKAASTKKIIERLIRSVYHNDATWARVGKWGDELNALRESSEFRRIGAEERLREIVTFLGGDGRKGSSAAAEVIRRELAAKLRGPLGRELLLQATSDPKRFRSWMSGVFDGLNSERFENFLGVLDRHLN